MDKKLDVILKEKGLKRIETLDEIVISNSFLIDTNTGNLSNQRFPIYPVVQDKLNLTHNLLNLYGIHWRYLVNSENWIDIEKQEGDLQRVLSDIYSGVRKNRPAIYAFSQKYVNLFKSLWIFIPDTQGWEYYTGVLLPQFKTDMEAYKQIKQAI